VVSNPLRNLISFVKQLPPTFLEQRKTDLGSDITAFMDALQEISPVSIRLNPHKKFPNTENLENRGKNVLYTEGGYFLNERPVFTLDPAFHAGAYYVQEASSMFIAEALSQVVDLQEDINVLDLCAAPGGKTTLLASVVSENSFILANEVIKSRVEVLKENIEKWGYPNIYVSNHDSEDFTGLNGFFDVVLVDAPCSGEGLFRKDERAIAEWSPENVQTCAARQKRILTNAVHLLKPNGVLLYSTCTYNDFENSDNVEWLLQNFDYQEVKLNLKPEWGITEKKHGYQFYPHKTIGEGFYCCVLKRKMETALKTNKPDSVKPFGATKLPKKQLDIVSKWLKNPEKFDYFIKPNGQIFIVLKTHLQYISLIDKALKRKSTGLEIGEFKGQDFIPSHGLALSIDISQNRVGVSLTKNEALHYLKKENIELENASQGWVLAQYEGLNLGWMKVMKNRINNYLPKDFRIRMDLPREN
jgi:16S rRNA C967 or C1407 C5-methylase (RsmB/RsmF family)/NOL1/NOP2/fmu family ribosome biogenesis protein